MNSPITTDTITIGNPTLALVSDATFSIDGESKPGVISVHRFHDDHIEITIQPLGQLPYPMSLDVIIDSNDLAHIKSLLDAQDRAAAQPASDPGASRHAMEDLIERLATIERRQEEDAVTFSQQAQRITALETAMHSEHRTMHATFNQHQARIDDLVERLAALESA